MLLIDNYKSLFKDNIDSLNYQISKITNIELYHKFDFKIRLILEFMMNHENTLININYVKKELTKLANELVKLNY